MIFKWKTFNRYHQYINRLLDTESDLIPTFNEEKRTNEQYEEKLNALRHVLFGFSIAKEKE